VQLNEIRRVTLEEFFQFTNVTRNFAFDRLVGLDMLVIEGEFHVCTLKT